MKRRAFTIVELLVAMALIVLIMAVLSQAFVEGLETFRRLKAIGDMQERMRTATTNLRLDLMARHLEQDRKLSSFNYNSSPTEGFFRLQQNPTPLGPIAEGIDGDGLPSQRAAN